MATVTYIRESKQTVSAMKGVIDYCMQDKKVFDLQSGRRLVSGVNCNGENAFTEFMATKSAYKKTDGINFYQYVQSFSPDESVTAEKAHEVALEFAEKAWPGYEVLVTTHSDAEHIHSHFVINSVSFETGYKLRQNPNTLKNLRCISDQICSRHGLSTLKPYEESGAKLSSREYRAAAKGQSWKFRLMADIEKAMQKCGSCADFIIEMNRRGYQITWTDERKYITFTCPNGMKCRDIKLHDEKYRKGNLEYELQLREQITEKQCSRFADTEECRSHNRTGTSAVPAGGICDTGNAENNGTQFGKTDRNLSADALSDDRRTGNQERGGRPLSGNSGNRSVVYREYSCETDSGKSESSENIDRGKQHDGAEDAVSRRTGWEESRRIYFETLFGYGQRNQEFNYGDRQAESQVYADSDRHISGGGLVIGNRIRGILEAGRIIENDTEDPEERRKRIEAQQAAANAGALIGLAVGIVSELAHRDDTPAEEKETEEQKFTMNM